MRNRTEYGVPIEPDQNRGKEPVTSGNTSKKSPSRKGSKKTTKRVPTKRATRYDWEAIRSAFIEGIPVQDGGQYERTFHTQKEIAELFEVPYQRVRERASKERWTQERHNQQVELAVKRQKERNDKILGDAIDFDESTLRVAKIGITLITTRLQEIAADVKPRKERRERALARMEAGEKIESWELYGAVNYKEMDSLASAAARLQEIGNKALGIDVQKHEVTGPGGGPIQVDHVSVSEELLRDDPERITAFMAAAARAGLDLSALNSAEQTDYDEEQGDGDSDVYEAELVDEEDAQ